MQLDVLRIAMVASVALTRGKSVLASSGLLASTHHSSARVTIIVVIDVLFWNDERFLTFAYAGHGCNDLK